jgi:hypothetical protein
MGNFANMAFANDDSEGKELPAIPNEEANSNALNAKVWLLLR